MDIPCVMSDIVTTFITNIVIICVLQVSLSQGAGCTGNEVFGLTDVSPPSLLVANVTQQTHITNDADFTITCCGVIKQWDIKVQQTGSISLQVWRPGAQHSLVGQNTFNLPSVGTNPVKSIPVNSANRIAVKPNDVIGWYSAGEEMIPYMESGQSVYMSDVGATSVGGSADTSAFDFYSGVQYAIKASVDANTAPTFSSLPVTLTYNDDSMPAKFLTLTYSDVDAVDSGNLVLSLDTSGGIGTLSGSDVLPDASKWDVGDYTLDFTLTDTCDNTVTETLTVKVINTAPVATATPTTATVAEVVTADEKISDITVVDVQTYTCTYTGSDPFSLRQKSGSTDYELYAKATTHTVSQYTVSITCTDKYGLTDTVSVTVDVLPNQKPVVNAMQASKTISAKTTGSGVQIYDATATDPENDPVTYTMTCNPAGCPFQILPSGKILTTSSLDLEKTSSYTISVTANDGHQDSDTVTTTLLITDINTVPTFQVATNGMEVTIPENEPTGTTLFDLTGEDPDGDTLTYIATFSPGEANNMFTVDSTTGAIKSKAAFNYEDLVSKGLTSVTASVLIDDGRERSDPVLITLRVTDVNEPQTGFAKSKYQINGHELTTTFTNPDGFVVNDPDGAPDKQTYSMDCGTAATEFSINPSTGVISKSTERDLDGPPGLASDTVTCTVTATDEADHTVTADVDIVIEEINDNPPELNQNSYTYYLSEDVGAVGFGSFSSTDDDFLQLNKDTTYTLSDPSGKFSVVDCCSFSTSGNFKPTYSAGSQFTMTLTATNDERAPDGTYLKDTATVTVILTTPPTTTTTTTSATAATQTTTTVATPNIPSLVSGSGSTSGNFLDDPENLAWFIPAMLLTALMVGLGVYMILRCCRNPSFWARLSECCSRGCEGLGRNSCRGCNDCNWKSKRAQPRPKMQKPPKIKIQEPETRKHNNIWNLWAETDFVNKNIELK